MKGRLTVAQVVRQLTSKGASKPLAVVGGLGLLLVLSLSGPSLLDSPAAPDLGLGDLVLRLGLVLALMVLSLLGLRRYVGRQAGAQSTGAGIQVWERHRLGPQQTLYVVTVADKALLLGVTPSQISSLADLGPAEAFATGERAQPVSFSDHLRSFGFSLATSGLAGGPAGSGRASDDVA